MLAIQALEFLAQEPDRLSRFLALTGLGPANLRGAARQPGFLASILDHMASDEGLLTAFAAFAGVPPESIGIAREKLARARASET